MRAYVSGILAGATLLCSALTGTASAAPDPVGTCGYSAISDPQVEGSMTAKVQAVVLLTDDTYPHVLHSGSVTCTLRSGWTHVDGDELAVVPGPVATGVAVAAGTATFAVERDEFVSICTRVDLLDGTTLYWDGENGTWSTSANVPCSPPRAEPVPGGTVLDELVAVVVCPILASLLPPDGDIPGIVDCPPLEG